VAEGLVPDVSVKLAGEAPCGPFPLMRVSYAARYLFESHLCLRFPRILIWMKSHGKASVGLSDPLFCGIPRDAKDFMRILAEALH